MLSLFEQRFGKLIAIWPQGKSKHRKILWLCQCDCGNEVIIGGSSLKSGHTRSCGCLKIEKIKQRSTKHGYGKSHVYRIWANMIQRCTNPNRSQYQYYGGRNIKVCKRWSKFKNFLKDMGEVPPGHQIDRINNNGNYCKSNCRWVTSKQQQRNKQNNRPITYNGRTQLLIEWAEETGIDRETIAARLKRGWSIEKALITPIQKHKVYKLKDRV